MTPTGSRKQSPVRSCIALITLGMGVVLGFLLLRPQPVHAGTCATTSTIGVDTTGADLLFIIFSSRAYGQTFLATDTVLKSVTVFRPGIPLLEINDTPLQLYITTVDALGVPNWRVEDRLWTGPLQSFPPTDGVHPLPIKFEINPPLVLPGPGRYYFTIKESWCSLFYTFLGKSFNPYPEGQAWGNGPGFGCTLGLPVDWGSDQDMCFLLEFCEVTTDALPTSWGRLKQIYR